MASQITSGKVLREARERKNYDLNTVARRLRIRPDILRAIEAGDFSAMPPRGYTRNMVNAYARLMGLNPTEIVDMYLDEAYAFQVERARGNARGSGFNMNRSRRPRPEANGNDYYGRGERAAAAAYGQEQVHEYAETDDGFRKRHLYDDRTPYSRDDYGLTRERVQKPGRSDRDFSSHHSGYDGSRYDGSSYAATREGAPRSGKRGREVHVGETPMSVTAPRLPAALRSRSALIVAGVLAILVIIVVFFFVTRNSGGEQVDDVSQLPVSGINDTTGTADNDSSETTVEIAPTSARIVMTVPDGKDCYIETYLDDGEAQPEILTGPTEKSLEVTGKWTITTFAADSITVTVNGEEAHFSVSDDYNGMYAYTVDFPKLLEEWKSTHTSKNSQRQAAIAEATSAQEAAANASSSAASKPGESDDEDDDEKAYEEEEEEEEDYYDYDEEEDYSYYDEEEDYSYYEDEDYSDYDEDEYY